MELRPHSGPYNRHNTRETDSFSPCARTWYSDKGCFKPDKVLSARFGIIPSRYSYRSRNNSWCPDTRLALTGKAYFGKIDEGFSRMNIKRLFVFSFLFKFYDLWWELQIVVYFISPIRKVEQIFRKKLKPFYFADTGNK